MKQEIRKTLLYDWHVEQGANMANFGGYEMPLWYPSGVRNEHLAVLTNAGMFDTSHMAMVRITGPDAYDLLQLCFTKDLNACLGINKKIALKNNRCVYGAFLNEQGEVIDDAIVYQVEKGHYLSVVNAGMGGEIARHLAAHKRGRNVEITDLTDKVGKLDIQGPLSAKILMKVLADPGKVFEKMPYFSFKGHFDPSCPSANAVCLTDGTPILLSRTGYTGEFGFEIFIAPEHFVRLWKMIFNAGKEYGLISCGLAARDSLRGGAVLPLSHQDIGHWPFINNPWPFALPYNEDQTDFTKSFIGDEALRNIVDFEFTYAFAGHDLRKVSAEDPAIVLNAEAKEIGTVLTCVTDMGIGRHKDRIYSVASPDKPKDFKPKGLCCGFVKVTSMLSFGEVVELRDKRRKVKVAIVEDIRPDRTARVPIKNMI
ncbi:aminomethyltransferase family protein [Desulfonema magnum]|uniref:Glycine cleavage system, aminomethyltransferase protein T n=1 Tax=Desulfonema magnum TaxID=45655 RepID=A0A975BS33_9BACT|nr:aminomethyltransferase family protein [Desulfonema magnum]QTA90697.1 Glycine cleavage system, aminomethyltransferase protein T [Desulfonema magnum]